MTNTSRGIPARTRILAWIMLVVTLAVVLIVAATGKLLFSRVENMAHIEVLHEVEKFRDYAERVEHAAGGAEVRVEDVLRGHLEQNLPEHSEALFALVNGVPRWRSALDPPARLDQNGQFVDYAGARTEPELGRWDTSAGPAVYGIVPVEVIDDPDTGHLIIVEFLAQEADEARQLLWFITIIGGIALATAGITGWFITGRVLAPIRELQHTAAAISETDLDRRIDIVGNDDVARLAQTFNSMLDRLANAFETQRQFLDDAGHELRTPVTIIRGHLELMGTDPQERRETLDLVDDELHRMGRLIDDLILLARSERPDFVRPRATNLTELVMETLVKATGLAPRTWMIDQTPDIRALVDSERLTQALLQLAANAVEHTEQGATIALGGRVDRTPAAPRIYLWVRDEGAGIAKEDHQRIFERFVRAGTRGDRDQSSGLGLAIVSRIATAHGGMVTVDSSIGRGSTFTLVLPYKEA